MKYPNYINKMITNFKSTDYGATWQGVSTLPFGVVNDMAFFPLLNYCTKDGCVDPNLGITNGLVGVLYEMYLT